MPDTSPAPAAADVERIRALVDGLEPELVALSHALSAEPELAYEEHLSAERCAALLEAHGLAVERKAYGLPTSFAARAGTTGPHVVICAEYDALPEVGHACGHNVIAASAVGAGIVLAGLAEEIGLRLTVLGTPAEEVGGGKVDLIRAGAFEGVDAAMMVHPSPFDDHAPSALAIEEWRVVVTGRTSHASAAPELGRNALDGLVLGYTSIGLLRQHFRPHQQVHGIITHGGAAPNIVPDHVEASYYLRAVDADDLEDLRTRIRNCLEGAAQASGTTVDITRVGNAYEPIDAHPGMAAAFSAACLALGRDYTPDPQGGLGGSTDFGNVSQLVPGLHADLAVHSWPVVNHQVEFAELCITEAGDQTMLEGAMAMALTCLRIAADPELLTRP
jgi:amidohydrolase